MHPMTAWIDFLSERSDALLLRTIEHLQLVGISMGCAVLLGVPLGITASRFSAIRMPLLSAVGILQTIPSIAMLGILLVLLGKIGAIPAVTALTLYALLPIVRNTFTGLQEVPDETKEAARGIGMSKLQQLLYVELPLALPVILAGIRTATVIGIGIATLSAFIGAGGYGQFINRGLALSNTRLILLGAVPAALLAVCVDLYLGAVTWVLKPSAGTSKRNTVRIILLILPLVCAGLIFAAYPDTTIQPAVSSGENEPRARAVIRIGCKNFTEQFILGEIMAQLIEAKTPHRIDRRFNLGGTLIVHEALAAGEIDLYAEYTGTALKTILDRADAITSPLAALETVRSAYREKYRCEWLEPFGFNNKYTISVHKEQAEKENWRTISDLAGAAPQLTAGFTAEFAERPDGYPGLQDAYGLQFREVKDLEPNLMYDAIDRGQVDVICAFATDSRIKVYELASLEDDRKFFPPYHAAPVIRTDTLTAHPELGRALRLLGNSLDNEAMKQLNFQVDNNKRAPRDVAYDFLKNSSFIEKGE